MKQDSHTRDQPTDRKKEGRIRRHIRTARQIRSDPKSAVGLFRGWFLKLWVARGGGLYGLGFAATFVVLEVRTVLGDFGSSESVSDFVTQEAMEYVLRLGYQSVINLVLAAIWPVLLLERLGWWALPLLAAGYFGFEHLLRPGAETRFPELREARVQREARRREKREKKAEKKARKAARSRQR